MDTARGVRQRAGWIKDDGVATSSSGGAGGSGQGNPAPRRAGNAPGSAGPGNGRPRRFPQWAMAIMAAVTLLALAILVLAIILGVRAGQRQVELRRTQAIAIALQKAMDYRAEGQVAAALAEYRNVLNLDPANSAAGEGIEALLQVAQGTPAAPAALVPTATTPAGAASAATPADSSALLRPQAVLSGATVAPTLPGTTAPALSTAAPAAAGDMATLLDRAQTAARAGRWQEAVALLEPYAAQAATNPTISTLLFTGYVNLATERDNENNLEEALGYYDKALAIQPTAAEVRNERTLIDTYINVVTVWEVDWPRAIALLTQLYAADPQYRDIKARLGEALVAYGESLGAGGDWCAAATQFQSATAVAAPTSDLLGLRDQATAACQNGGTPTALTTGTSTATVTTAATPMPAGAGPTSGRILYAARDAVDGRTRIFAQPAAGSAAAIVIEDGAQPALHRDGLRYVYRNLRGDQGGLSAVDPSTGIFFRITDYAEDVLPSWDPSAARVVFASNREGDRRWRIYTVWAEENGAVNTLSFGEAPAWNPVADLIVHRGCDESGNGCGLWLMDSAGANRHALTSVASDNRPAWAPNGGALVFMSDGRDGNMEIYRLDLTGGSAPVRLTNDPATDAAPTVSPDGAWVAFISNRDGAWKLYAVPIAGGAAHLIAPLKGDVGDFHMQGMQWVR